MIRVCTGSRLHLGFFDLPGAGPWPTLEGDAGLPRLAWGGVGMMIDRPGVVVAVQPASEWSSSGPCAERALAFAQTVAQHLPGDPLDLHVESCPAEHSGLGTGTQLALAVGLAVARSRCARVGVWQLARWLGRGKRSCLGIHGFRRGGFLIEATHAEGRFAPLLLRRDFPPHWPITLIEPQRLVGTHGTQEKQAFAALREVPRTSHAEALARLAFLEMVPALRPLDPRRFGSAVTDFNRRVGEMFRPWQGGIYADPAIAQIVAKLRGAEICGVAQSSWGPTIVAFAEAGEVARLLHGEEVAITKCRALNQGVRVISSER